MKELQHWFQETVSVKAAAPSFVFGQTLATLSASSSADLCRSAAARWPARGHPSPSWQLHYVGDRNAKDSQRVLKFDPSASSVQPLWTAKQTRGLWGSSARETSSLAFPFAHQCALVSDTPILLLNANSSAACIYKCFYSVVSLWVVHLPQRISAASSQSSQIHPEQTGQRLRASFRFFS